MAKKTSSKDQASGLGIAVAAAAAAGIYFLYGSKDAKKNRKVIKGWTLKAKGEVLEKMEQAKEQLTEENYHMLVDGVMDKYKKLKGDHQEEIDAAVKELKGHWKSIKKHVGAAAKTSTKAVAKSATKSKKEISK
jgi:hypothetical protein